MIVGEQGRGEKRGESGNEGGGEPSGKTLLLYIHHSGIRSPCMSSSNRRGCAAIGSDM